MSKNKKIMAFVIALMMVMSLTTGGVLANNNGLRASDDTVMEIISTVSPNRFTYLETKVTATSTALLLVSHIIQTIPVSEYMR